MKAKNLFEKQSMKRIGGLYEKVISIENLELADKRARFQKANSYGVRLHDKNREANILNLHHQLKDKTYKTSKYDIFQIYSPKERDIYRLPYYPDRIVHHAIMNIMESIWVSVFTKDTYSCIKNRGIHLAVDTLKKGLKDVEGTKYCLKMDVRKFYPTINHGILIQLIERKIKDKDLIWLMTEIILSVEEDKGIPIGNYLSQYFANLYLAYFDHWLKEELKVKYYWRYADDMVILHSSKDHLHYLFNEIEKYLKEKLELEIKDNWQIFPVSSRGIDFVGYVFYHSHTLLRKSIKKNMAKKICKTGKVSQVAEQRIYKSLASYWGWCKHCDSINLITKLLKNTFYENKFRC